jgi:hypothetical protein
MKKPLPIIQTDSTHLQWAREMKEKFPDALKDYTVEEVQVIWEAHSEDLCAGWIATDSMYDKAEVEEIFGKYYFKDDRGRIVKLIREKHADRI